MADSPYALVVCGDSNPDYARGVAVTVHSALRCLSRDFRPDLYVVDCGIPDDAKVRLEKVAAKARPDISVRWITFDLSRLSQVPNRSMFPSVVYARLFIAELVAEGTQRAISLDGDLLVCRDLSALLTLDLGGTPLAAVQDIGGAALRSGHPYFNAGVFAIDPHAWRRHGLQARTLEYADAHEDVPFGDQDCFNAVLERWFPLDYSWNLQLGGLMPGIHDGWMKRDELTRLYRRLRFRPRILHFTIRKPWVPSQAGPGGVRWALCFARCGWYPSLEATGWFCRWLVAVSRVRAGTTRLAFRKQLHTTRLRRSG